MSKPERIGDIIPRVLAGLTFTHGGMMQGVELFSDAELRAECNRRGYEMHHKGFSASMQNEIRACVKLQHEAKALEERITNTLAAIAKAEG